MGLQILTIVLSRGNIFLLGEAYAFGVMWSFALKGLAVLVLRYGQPGLRDFCVPFNVTIGGVEIPVGLALITIVLFALCARWPEAKRELSPYGTASYEGRSGHHTSVG